MDKDISEQAFGKIVEDMLNKYGWLWKHDVPVRSKKGWRTAYAGHKGFPDYIAVRPPRILIAELKDRYKIVSPEQQIWLDKLTECQIIMSTSGGILLFESGNTEFGIIPRINFPEVYVWRPADIEEIEEILKP